MKRLSVLCAAAVLACLPAGRARAQESLRGMRTMRIVYNEWLPGDNSRQRYLVAVRPLYLFNGGLRADFGIETARPGWWVEVEATVRFNARYRDDALRHCNFESDFDPFVSSAGCGVGVACKRIFSPQGWYVAAGARFDYNRIRFDGVRYVMFREDGSEFWRPAAGVYGADVFKPAVKADIGIQKFVTRRMFVDFFCGLGYDFGFAGRNGRNPVPPGDGLYGFWHHGLFVDYGFRLGWILYGK